MRELWATGWIHNKMRVIVSSFAVKMLLIPWKWGMKYFWDTLLDADLESDILGWQYISGSLPDGHKLERLDDPEVCRDFFYYKVFLFSLCYQHNLYSTGK
jgi:cryptochrome 2